MDPLKIILRGRFYDAHIYMGKLALFTDDGRILGIDWREVLNSLHVNRPLLLALEAAFGNSSLLYDAVNKPILHDLEIKGVVESKFNRLSRPIADLDLAAISKFAVSEQENLFPFPHADCEIYGKKIFVCSSDGIYKSLFNGDTKKLVSTRVDRFSDCPGLSIKASYNSLAIAAGSEGLYDMPIDGMSRSSNVLRNISTAHVNSCNWAYHNIVGSSGVSDGVLAEYDKTTVGNESDRQFRETTSLESIFNSSGYSWGVQDKLCQANGGLIKFVKYNPFSEQKDDQRTALESIQLQAWKGNVLAASIAPFGIVVECENALVVRQSDGGDFTITGPIVGWRVYPRSINYQNHLHVIFEDRIEIYSFNHDYFIDQKTKLCGTNAGRRSYVMGKA